MARYRSPSYLRRQRHRSRASRTRKAWLRFNPPDEHGFYDCELCGYPVHLRDMTLDHIVPWREDESKRFDIRNLQPAHGWCNEERGRQDNRSRWVATP